MRRPGAVAAAVRGGGLAAALVAGPAAFAHEVDATVAPHTAAAVTIVYADGTPFAGESYDVLDLATGRTVLAGRTDAAGRALLPLGAGRWRLRAFADDGHGLDREFAVAATLPPDPTASPAATGGPAAAAATSAATARTGRAVLGLGVLLTVFGAGSLALAGKRRRAVAAAADPPHEP